MVSRRNFLSAAAALPLATIRSSEATAGVPLGSALATTLSAGEYPVSGNIVIKGDLLLLPGATIRISAGRTLTVLGDFQAPASHVFTGLGTVDLTQSRVAVARPEWWGAVPNDPAIDCVAAIESCLMAHHTLLFGIGDYHLHRTLQITKSHRRVRGMGRSRPEPGATTRLVLTAAKGDVVAVGTPTRPATIIDFVQGLEIRGLHFARLNSAFDATAGDSGAADAGLRVRYVLNCLFEDLVSQDHPIGFSFGGTVRSFVRDCQAFMRMSLQGAAKSQFWGFHFDGDVDIGLAGGNASLYVGDCNVNTTYGEPSPRSIGAYLSGAFADVYLVGFECSEVARGIAAHGVAASTNRAIRRSGNADLHIIMPILDQCRAIALEIINTSDHSLIDIISPYAALSGPGSAAIKLDNIKGQLSITGGQMLGWTNQDAGGNGAGLMASNAIGFSVVGLKLLGFPNPVVLRGCFSFDVCASVSNPDGDGKHAAVVLEKCEHGSCRIRVTGKSKAFETGVKIVGGRAVVVEAVGINADALARGPNGRVVINDIQVTKDGTFPKFGVTGLFD